MTKELLIETENRIKEHWESGDIPYLTHLCGGNEEFLLDFYEQNIDCQKDWVLCSHRTHYHALLFGLHPDELVDQVLNGKSMFIYRDRFLCSAIVAGVCSIACGIAIAAQQKGTQERVWCFVGDGATDEGSFWEAVRFCDNRGLPLKFIVEDNCGQCGVGWNTRWGKPLEPLKDYPGESLNDLGWEMTGFNCIEYYQYEPTYPHAGTLDKNGKPTRPPIRWPIERK